MGARPNSYFVCMVQRCGSNLLCEALARSGVAGRPTEYFHPPFPGAAGLGHGWAGFEGGEWARERGIATFPEFLRAVRAEGSTPNGVFGAKLPWNALAGLLGKLAELPGCAALGEAERLAAAFDGPRFIHLQRRDRVRQAVSWAIAAQTGHYSSRAAASLPRLCEPSFDLELLDRLGRAIDAGEAGWATFFAAAGSEPLRLYYEDLVADLEGSLRCVLAWLGVEAPARLDLSGLGHERQGGAVNDEWAARFRALQS
jgi:LPS sulfotransferase NodH